VRLGFLANKILEIKQQITIFLCLGCAVVEQTATGTFIMATIAMVSIHSFITKISVVTLKESVHLYNAINIGGMAGANKAIRNDKYSIAYVS
jgi:hypothetical protein